MRKRRERRLLFSRRSREAPSRETQFAADLEMSDVVRVVMTFALVKADSKSKSLDAQKENYRCRECYNSIYFLFLMQIPRSIEKWINVTILTG